MKRSRNITKHYLRSDALIVTKNNGITVKKTIFHLIVLRSLSKSPVHVWEKGRTLSTRDKRILWGILWKHRLENTPYHFRNINKRYLFAHKIRSSTYEKYNVHKTQQHERHVVLLYYFKIATVQLTNYNPSRCCGITLSKGIKKEDNRP